jgi:hypothetical protein
MSSEPPVSLSKWFRSCGVVGLKKESSIPAKVASLLDWDIRNSINRVGFFYNSFSKASSKKLSNLDAAKITTGIIDHCLFYDQSFSELIDDELNSVGPEREIEKITSLVLESNAPKVDPIMKDWKDRDVRKMNERFKRPRGQVQKDILRADRLIKEQMAQGMYTEYPVGGPYPFPLWGLTES